MKKTKFVVRRLRKIMILVLIVSFMLHLSIVPSFGLNVTDVLNVSFDEKLALVLVNLYSNSDTKFTFKSTRILKNSSGDMAYTIVELEPYGYAIFNNSNTLLVEAAFNEDATPPINMTNDLDYYYIGPAVFAVKKENRIISIDDGSVLDEKMLQMAKEFEGRICSVSKDKLVKKIRHTELQMMAAGNPAIQTRYNSVGETFFSNLNDFAVNKQGTCTVIAAMLLFAYYDYYIHSSYISPEYSLQSVPTNSIGVNDEFHELLCDYVYGNNTPGAINIDKASVGLNAYLNSRSLPVSIEHAPTHDHTYAQTKIVEVLNTDRPVIASMYGYIEEYEGDRGHSVVVYGYRYIIPSGIELNSLYSVSDEIDFDTLMFRTHFGWKTSGSNDRWITAAGFHQYGYITSCTETGTHYNAVEGYTGKSIHVGDYHRYERSLICASCGGNETYDWEILPCDGYCITVNSADLGEKK